MSRREDMAGTAGAGKESLDQAVTFWESLKADCERAIAECADIGVSAALFEAALAEVETMIAATNQLRESADGVLGQLQSDE